MSFFKVSDLDPKYHYNKRHDTGDNPKKIGHPDRELLDRNEAYEMVDYINHLLKTLTWTIPITQDNYLSTGRKIERLIKDHLPGHLRSKELSITPWIRNNWSNY